MLRSVTRSPVGCSSAPALTTTLEPAGEGVHGGRRWGDAAERPQHGDAGRLRVEALGLGADDGLVDASGAALEDRAEAIDEEVVPDVTPAQRLHVVGVDPPHDSVG